MVRKEQQQQNNLCWEGQPKEKGKCVASLWIYLNFHLLVGNVGRSTGKFALTAKEDRLARAH